MVQTTGFIRAELKTATLFISIGVSNTLVALTIFTLLVNLGVSGGVSNLFAVAFGLFTSFILHAKARKSSNPSGWRYALKFIVSVAVAYMANLATFFWLTASVEFPLLASQLVAMALYSLTFFATLRLLTR